MSGTGLLISISFCIPWYPCVFLCYRYAHSVWTMCALMHTHMYKKNDVEVELCHQVYNDSSCNNKRAQQATDQSRAVTFGWRLWRGIWLEAGMMEMGLLWREWWTAFDGEESSGKSGENGKRSLIQGLDLGGLEAVTFPWLTWVRQKSREGTRRATRKCWRGWGGSWS